MTFVDFERWARGQGVQAVLIATGAVLLGRLLRGGHRLVARSEHG